MDPAHIDALLAPFLRTPLAASQLEALSTYLDLLLRWNARLNLTAVREASHIVERHFGESLFAASQLLSPEAALRAIDVGSGPGFPGLPLKIFCPGLRLTLIEAQHKKATFLKEVIRALRLEDTDVFVGRAQDFPTPGQADLVTLRAVERFEGILPVAAALLRPARVEPASSPARPTSAEADGSENAEGRMSSEGRVEDTAESSAADPGCPILSEANVGGVPPRLALLIGASQVASAHRLAPNFRWKPPLCIPQSSARIVLVGSPEL